MEMAQLIRLSLALLCCSVVVLSTETSENNYNDVVQFILNWYNEKSDSQHVYNSAKILNAYKKNDSEPLYLLQLEVVTICNSSQNCHSSALICEVGVRENLSSHSKEVLTDRAKCVKKEIEPVIPSFGHGFVEENITDEIRSIAAFAIQQSQSNGANKRSVIDIMSVKRQVVGNATTLYLTLKVTKNEGGDAVQFEICEAEVNQTGEMAWESSLSCFPLNGLSSETPINAEDITTVAERAADEMDSLSFSEFTLKLMDVLKAETTVTPGSEGTMTNLELRLTPTVCLKNVDVENDAYGLYSNRLCPENNTNKRLVCSLTSWDRPWVDDTLYSEPSCRIETPIAISNQTQSTNTHAIQNDSPDVMMNDEMEPENEEVFIPAVEHHSIPMVEELDPIIEQILPDIEKPGASEVEEPLIPVVEEPIVAKHVYCTGCPIDLDVNNPALDEFVEQALASIDDSSNGQNMYRATRITKAQKQVVNGVKYILHLEVAETICRKDSGHNRGTCETSNNEIKTCIVEFLEKPWIDSSRVIVSNNCTRYNNDLENEIKPHFVSHSHLARQEIFDYLDEMEEPKPIPNSEDFPSYGKDSLYPPESEPTNHPLERDAEEIEIKTTADEHRKSEKAVMESSHASSDVDRKTESPAESEESKESEENQTEKHTTVNNSGESDESSEESKENQEEKLDKIAAYISNENRNRRETSLTTNFGALKEIGDSEKELANKLAEIAVNTLDEIDEDDKKRVVLEILSAHKQIVNGMMYHLLLRIVSTSCSELGHSDPSCVNEQLSPVRICKVELHRSFASNSQLDAKVVKSECTVENENASEKKLRRKRDVSVVTGVLYPANTSEPYITQMADFAVTELDKCTNSLYRQCIIRIDNASKQVVAGYNIYLTLILGDSVHRKGENISGNCQLDANVETRECQVTIWHRPWIENSQRVTSFNCSSNEVRSKRETSETHHRLIGGPIDADTNDTYIQELAGTALEEVNRRSNGIYEQKTVRIIEAKTQVVSGVKVRLTMEFGYTNCRKGSEENKDCQLNENSNNQICYIEIWDRSWLSDRRVTNFSCSPAASSSSDVSPTTEPSTAVNRKKRHIPGGHTTANTSDPYIQEIAGTALLEVDRRSNALHKQQIVNIISATKQVVAGLNVHLVMELGYTTCLKGTNGTESCPLSENSNNQICHVEVWDRPWLQDRRVTNISCSAVSDSVTITSTNTERSEELTSAVTRKKRDTLGGHTAANTSDPYIQEIAGTALLEVDRRSNALHKQQIVNIISATKQVVAGLNVHLVMELGYTTCRKGTNETESCPLSENSNNQICHVEVWDRPWLQDRRVTNISCSAVSDSVTITSTNTERSEELTSAVTRKKRDTLGGHTAANTSDPYIQEIAGTALLEVDRRSNALHKQQIVNIISATKQVVAGLNVHLVMELGYTTCRKGTNETESCPLSENSNNQICHVVVWDRPWLQDRRVTNISCSAVSDSVTITSTNTERSEELTSAVTRKKRDTLGGHTAANTSDPYIQEIAGTALLEVDRRSNALHKQQIVNIISATKQVVAGLKIHLVMELGYTTCRKGGNATESCPLSENSNNQICHMEVWDRPWLQDRRVTNISCSAVADSVTISSTNTELSDELETTNRLKRHVGGFSKVEVDDPYVLQMAKTVLVEYDKKSNALFKQKIIRIIEAQRQVVAGTLTRLTIEIGYSKCRKGHEVDVETCELRENSKNQICHVEVWDRPWLNKREIKKSSCNPSISTRSKRKSLKHDFQVEAFQNFIEKYNKKYSSNAEYKQRFHIFRANLKKIDLLQRTEQGTATYGITQFADLSKREFKKYHLGLNRNLKDSNEIPMQEAVIPNVELLKEFDWRHYNAVTEVKNQGSCGSCWAFSVTGNIEGQWKINKGKLVSLSEQELVDCDTLDDGCNGGLPENAYKAIEKLGGLETEGDYPYEGDDEKCHFKKSDVKVTIQGSVNITKNETKMAQWLYKNGPMSIGINANAMQFYMGGVSHPWKFLCNGDDLDHGVLIVGYGVHNTSILHRTLPYWTIKNSWGKHWGEQGYYRVYRGDGTCGVNQMVTSAIVG